MVGAVFVFMLRLPLLLLILLAAEVQGGDDPVALGLDRAVQFFDAKLKSDPDDFVAMDQLVDRLMRRSRWTGRLEDLRRADEVSQLSLQKMSGDTNPPGLIGRARVLFALHRFGEASDLARQLETFQPGKPAPQQLLGDALLELGDLDGAEKAFAEAERRGTADWWSEYEASRLAWQRGDPAAAAKHLEAVVTLSAGDSTETKVWALVQRGELAFRRGQHEAAEKDYLAALALAPKHWNVLEHLGELRGTQGKYEEAASIFHQIATATDRPEEWQALGDLHLFYQKPEAAKLAFDTARAGYRASLARHEGFYVHHLAAFFCDSEQDAKSAVELAQQDLKLRQTAAAWDSLAWALYRSGDFKGALEASGKAIAGGIRDFHILYHAGTIHLSAGEVPEGQRLLRRAAEANPHFAGFHMHH